MRLIIISFFILLISSCKTTEYIPVKEVHEQVRNVYKRDSIYIKDFIHVYSKGDTIVIKETNTKFVNTYHSDTLYVMDSIPTLIEIPKYIYVEVEKELSVFDKIKLKLGGYVFIFIIGLIIAIIANHKFKFLKLFF